MDSSFFLPLFGQSCRTKKQSEAFEETTRLAGHSQLAFPFGVSAPACFQPNLQRPVHSKPPGPANPPSHAEPAHPRDSHEFCFAPKHHTTSPFNNPKQIKYLTELSKKCPIYRMLFSNQKIMKPSSKVRIRSSRANGALSRGPVSEAGKRRSARNSLFHGIYSKALGEFRRFTDM